MDANERICDDLGPSAIAEKCGQYPGALERDLRRSRLRLIDLRRIRFLETVECCERIGLGETRVTPRPDRGTQKMDRRLPVAQQVFVEHAICRSEHEPFRAARSPDQRGEIISSEAEFTEVAPCAGASAEAQTIGHAAKLTERQPPPPPESWRVRSSGEVQRPRQAARPRRSRRAESARYSS